MSTHDESDFDRHLTSTLERLAPRPRSDLIARVDARLSDTSQRHRWLARMASLGSGPGRWRYAAFGGVAALALVTGIAIGGSGLLRVAIGNSPMPTASGPSVQTPGPSPSESPPVAPPIGDSAEPATLLRSLDPAEVGDIGRLADEAWWRVGLRRSGDEPRDDRLIIGHLDGTHLAAIDLGLSPKEGARRIVSGPAAGRGPIPGPAGGTVGPAGHRRGQRRRATAGRAECDRRGCRDRPRRTVRLLAHAQR